LRQIFRGFISICFATGAVKEGFGRDFGAPDGSEVDGLISNNPQDILFNMVRKTYVETFSIAVLFRYSRYFSD
jgi:hypothetical protein